MLFPAVEDSRKMDSRAEVIYTAFPCYGRPDKKAARQFWWLASRPDGPYRHLVRTGSDEGGSLLGPSFDWHWATALNMQRRGVNVTRFAMLHADVVPGEWWLDTLLEDLDRTGADVMAALIPIKDERGLTSTAIDYPGGWGWGAMKRISLAEAAALPDVFSAADCGHPDRLLLANTGCWVCDFTKPWRLAETGKGTLRVNFQIRNAIYRCADGRYQPVHDPEDWGFSRAVGQLGGKVLVTKRVKVEHVGEHHYSNVSVWGAVALDRPDDNPGSDDWLEPLAVGIQEMAAAKDACWPPGTVRKVRYDSVGGVPG